MILSCLALISTYLKGHHVCLQVRPRVRLKHDHELGGLAQRVLCRRQLGAIGVRVLLPDGGKGKEGSDA